ncbi:MAG TPA: pyrroline-5-carboxylate reductase [Pseudolabrys sp.]|nr:pyrroline-5-carboxylate reductase [Pseudolabrys sp.]
MAATQNNESLADFRGRLVLVGAGKMGSAMLEGWLGRGLKPASVAVIEPQPSSELTKLAASGVSMNPAVGDVGEVSAVVLAVKPQTAQQVVSGLRPLIGAGTVLVSIMAGRTIAFLARELGKDAAIVRAMPNTPAAIGRGITVAVGNARVGAAQRALAAGLLAAIGKVEWVDDEGLMDAVTAVSGSGPAYVFLLAEALAQAGVAAGLPPTLAATLARETVSGSGELLHRSPLPPATLRQNVTSPGGTTAAALDVLMGRDGLQAVMTAAVAAATKRSRELAG